MTEPDPLLSVAALKILSKHTGDRYDEARESAQGVLNPGDRRTVVSPLDGSDLGLVYRAKPEKQAVITDEPALVEWLKAHDYPGMVRSSYKITGTEQQVVAVLFEHAPHLLRRVENITSDARKALISESRAAGRSKGPSSELDVPGISVAATGPTYVACKPAEGALLSIYELITSGRIALDGTVTPELEAPSDE